MSASPGQAAPPPPPFSSQAPDKPAWGALILVLLAAALLALAWRYTPLSEFIAPQRLSAWAEAMRASNWVPAALVFAYTPAALMMFPRQLITLTAVVAFGPLAGLAYASLGILLAALVFFAAGHWISYGFIRRLCGRHMDSLRGIARERGVLAVLAANVSPVPPFAIKATLAGVIRIRLRDYVLGILLSMLPGILAVTAFGHELSRALADPSQVSVWKLAMPVVLFFAFAYALHRALTGRRQA